MELAGEHDGSTKSARSRLRRALLAQDHEIELLERAVRDLRARHLELQEAFEEEWLSSSQTPAAASEQARMDAEPDGPDRGAADAVMAQQAGTAEENLLRDARRFARLLVSEIALYHPEQVEAGRRNRDLYTRLKSSIERSRQAYEHRFGQSAAGRQQFFHEELVRALAENDIALLGADYPGPSA